MAANSKTTSTVTAVKLFYQTFSNSCQIVLPNPQLLLVLVNHDPVPVTVLLLTKSVPTTGPVPHLRLGQVALNDSIHTLPLSRPSQDTINTDPCLTSDPAETL